MPCLYVKNEGRRLRGRCMGVALAKTADLDCTSGATAPEEDDYGKLTLQNIGGAFIFHFMLTGDALTIVLRAQYLDIGKAWALAETEDLELQEMDQPNTSDIQIMGDTAACRSSVAAEH